MTPSFGSYIGGCLATIGIVAALGLGGYWLRRWIVPEFSGALARLADATIAVALLILALQLLGDAQHPHLRLDDRRLHRRRARRGGARLDDGAGGRARGDARRGCRRRRC